MDKLNEMVASMKKKLDSFVSQDEAFWMSVAMFLFGVIVGMLISPRKQITLGSHNSSTVTKHYSDEDECDCGCDCDCE